MSTSIRRDDVRKFIVDFLNRKLKEQRRALLGDVSDDYDMFQSGIIDSLAFVELITTASQHFGWEIDLEGLDPERMATVGPLCAYVSGELNLHPMKSFVPF